MYLYRPLRFSKLNCHQIRAPLFDRLFIDLPLLISVFGYLVRRAKDYKKKPIKRRSLFLERNSLFSFYVRELDYFSDIKAKNSLSCCGLTSHVLSKNMVAVFLGLYSGHCGNPS